MTTFTQLSNDSNNPVPKNMFSSRLLTGKHMREETARFGENTSEAVANRSTRFTHPSSRKRLKPDFTIQPTFTVLPRKPPDPSQLLQTSSPVVQCTDSCAEDEGSQGNGNCGTSEDEDEAVNPPYCGNFSCQRNAKHETNEHKAPTTLMNPNSDVDASNQAQKTVKASQKIEQKKAGYNFSTLESFISTQGYTILKKKTDGLALKCPEGHNVNVKYKDKLDFLDCKKCKKRLLKCVQHAHLNNGRVKSEKFSLMVRFECSEGHEWESRYGKSLFKHWCPSCERIHQEERKKVLQEEAERAQQEAIREQNAKLEEARLHMQKEQQVKSKDYQALFYQWDVTFEESALNDYSINKLSKELSEKYVRENGCSLWMSMEDLFLMYKMLITSKEMLTAKLGIIPKADLCSFYRRCASRLHPDKNKHPRASEAFQKLTECYKQCCLQLSS